MLLRPFTRRGADGTAFQVVRWPFGTICSFMAAPRACQIPQAGQAVRIDNNAGPGRPWPTTAPAAWALRAPADGARLAVGARVTPSAGQVRLLAVVQEHHAHPGPAFLPQ